MQRIQGLNGIIDKYIPNDKVVQRLEISYDPDSDRNTGREILLKNAQGHPIATVVAPAGSDTIKNLAALQEHVVGRELDLSA